MAPEDSFDNGADLSERQQNSLRGWQQRSEEYGRKFAEAQAQNAEYEQRMAQLEQANTALEEALDAAQRDTQPAVPPRILSNNPRKPIAPMPTHVGRNKDDILRDLFATDVPGNPYEG